MLRPALIGLVILGTAACTSAPGAPKSASEAASDPAKAGAPEEQKICRDMSTTGSYGSRHVCHTKAQWEKIDALG